MTPEERFKPDANLVEMAFAKNKQLMAENATSYTQDWQKGDTGRDKTATETMALVNSANALTSGMLSLAYTYEEFKYREMARRFCLQHSKDPMVRRFRLNCLKDGVAADMLDVDRWEISAERVLGAGNKTLELAQAQGLQAIRKNLGPEAQRKADHIMVEALTDDPALAEDMAPIAGEKHISKSAHDAQAATERLLRGLPYQSPSDAIPEDYVIVWLMDLAAIVEQKNKAGGMATREEIAGMSNLMTHIQDMLKLMAENKDEKERVKIYQDNLTKLVNLIRAFAQRLQQQTKGGNGAGKPGIDPETQAKLQGKLMIDKAKAQNMRESHAAKTAQRQVAFEMSEQQKDRKHNAELRRESTKTVHEMATNRLRAFQE